MNSMDLMPSITRCFNTFNIEAEIGISKEYCVIHTSTIGSAKLVRIALNQIGLSVMHEQPSNFRKGVYSILLV